MKNILHLVPGASARWNGIAVLARMLAEAQGARCADVRDLSRASLAEADEIWVHSCWTPRVWLACRAARAARKPLVRMTHGCLDPVRLGYHAWRKSLAGPVERFFFRRCDRIVATCAAEKGWIESYLGRRRPPVEVLDPARFFDLSRAARGRRSPDALHLLYLGRRHPLKGVAYLEEAARRLQASARSACSVQLRIVSDAFGEEKEKVWDWCDVLVLPTLSENFGLVVAEALARGRRVVVTDGAPAWESACRAEIDGVLKSGYDGRLLCVKGFRAAAPARRAGLLLHALETLL